MVNSEDAVSIYRGCRDNIAQFVHWVEVNGGRFKGCKLKPCEDGTGLGLYTVDDHLDNGVLMVIPLALAITPMTVLQDASVGSAFAKLFEDGDVDDRLVVQLFLLVEGLRRDKSFWAPYLKLLPTEFGSPLFFNDEDLDELKGTALYRATKIQKANLHKHFHEKMKGFAEAILASVGWHEREVQFDDFLWANCVFWTRALNVPCPQSLVSPKLVPKATPSLEKPETSVNDTRLGSRDPVKVGEDSLSPSAQQDTKMNLRGIECVEPGNPLGSSARDASETCSATEVGGDHALGNGRSSDAGEKQGYEPEANVSVEGLVPGIDFCNHAKKAEAEASWEVDDGQAAATGVPYSIYLNRGGNVGLPSNTQVRISYGDKGNEELLYLYGFVLDYNIDDYLMIHFPKEALDRVVCPESKLSLLEAQNLSLRWLLSLALLQGVHQCQEATGALRISNSPVHNYSWSGHRKPPRDLGKQIFPEDLMAALRVIAMTEDEIESTIALLEELSDPPRGRFPSSEDIRVAVWEVCGDAGALQLLQDLLTSKLLELEEGTGCEEEDAQLLDEDAKAQLEATKREQFGSSHSGDERTLSQSLLSKNRRACVIYRKGQKLLAKSFLREAEQYLESWIRQLGA